jgi:hypothetical protein
VGLAERVAAQHLATCAQCNKRFTMLRRQRGGRRRAYEWRARKSKFCSWRCYRGFMSDRRRATAAKPKPLQGQLLTGKLTDAEIRFGAQIAELEIEAERPRSRLECANGPRPCPWVSCRYNLYLDVTASGSIRVNLPIAVDKMRESCVLDFDDRPQSQVEIGDLLGLSRQRAQQIEEHALALLVKRHGR